MPNVSAIINSIPAVISNPQHRAAPAQIRTPDLTILIQK